MTYNTQADKIALAKTIALQYDLDQKLVCAICEHESSWNPWAVRYEPAFEKKYDPTVGISLTEHMGRAFSYGLMQIMGETARELGFTEPYLTELCDPSTGLEFGCRKLVRCFGQTPDLTDIRSVLLKYNGGGDSHYPDLVIPLMAKY